jgi:hypothetical protein
MLGSRDFMTGVLGYMIGSKDFMIGVLGYMLGSLDFMIATLSIMSGGYQVSGQFGNILRSHRFPFRWFR